MAQLMPLNLLSLASVKFTLVLVLPFWYRLTRVVPDKGPLNGCARVVFALSKAMDAPDEDEYRRMLTIILASIFAGTILLALVAIVVVAVWRRRAGRPGKATIVANHGLAAAQRRTSRPRIGHGSKRFEIANETAPKNTINTDV